MMGTTKFIFETPSETSFRFPDQDLNKSSIAMVIACVIINASAPSHILKPPKNKSDGLFVNLYVLRL